MNSTTNELTHAVIGMAIEVHRELGPGLLESAYEECLAHELRQSTIEFARQKPVPVTYKGLELDCGYRIDLLVEDQLVIELKSVEELIPLFDAQILTYMKLADKSIGLLINFNVPVLKSGLKRFVR
ncbi:MAG TPA: GxxExxY protein [Chthoniobacterales bacterium]|jgi:GxxExxY protein|nr:GxxExxY protein [Chthoniobacterales bacterium]